MHSLGASLFAGGTAGIFLNEKPLEITIPKFKNQTKTTYEILYQNDNLILGETSIFDATYFARKEKQDTVLRLWWKVLWLQCQIYI